MEMREKDLRQAIAITYGEGLRPPRVAAKGRGVTAEAIIACARDAGVYVHEAPDLVALLMQLETDQYVPAELYRAVAELLAWIYRLEIRDDFH